MLRRDSAKKSCDGGGGAPPDAAQLPSASAASQVRARCKALVGSSSRFRPEAMPRRGAALLAGRAARRTAARSMLFAMRGRLAGQSRPNCPLTADLSLGWVTGLSLTLAEASSLSRWGDGSRGARGLSLPCAPLARPLCRARAPAGPRRLAFLAGAAPRVRRRPGDGRTRPAAFRTTGTRLGPKTEVSWLRPKNRAHSARIRTPVIISQPRQRPPTPCRIQPSCACREAPKAAQ